MHNAITMRTLAELADTALFFELNLDPKPGLVTPTSRGSHPDMDYALFEQSGKVLKPFWLSFATIGAEIGSDFVCFNTAKRLIKTGIDAETAMLEATRGINTHRGLIYSLGLTTASTSIVLNQTDVNVVTLCPMLSKRIACLAEAITQLTPNVKEHTANRAKGLSTISDEAARGFPAIFELGVPTYFAKKAQGYSDLGAWQAVMLNLLAIIDDTTWHKRAQSTKSVFAYQSKLRKELAQLASEEDQSALLLRCAAYFKSHGLTCGGVADMVAVTFFVVKILALL